eukprot:1132320_1
MIKYVKTATFYMFCALIGSALSNSIYPFSLDLYASGSTQSGIDGYPTNYAHIFKNGQSDGYSFPYGFNIFIWDQSCGDLVARGTFSPYAKNIGPTEDDAGVAFLNNYTNPNHIVAVVTRDTICCRHTYKMWNLLNSWGGNAANCTLPGYRGAYMALLSADASNHPQWQFCESATSNQDPIHKTFDLDSILLLDAPTCTLPPTNNPTANPTVSPTFDPTLDPTSNPTLAPSNPTLDPTSAPSNPTSAPSNPTLDPTSNPTLSPTLDPTANPTPIYAFSLDLYASGSTQSGVDGYPVNHAHIFKNGQSGGYSFGYGFSIFIWDQSCGDLVARGTFSPYAKANFLEQDDAGLAFLNNYTNPNHIVAVVTRDTICCRGEYKMFNLLTSWGGNGISCALPGYRGAYMALLSADASNHPQWQFCESTTNKQGAIHKTFDIRSILLLNVAACTLPPTNSPTRNPTNPTPAPSDPTSNPTVGPTNDPTSDPTINPTFNPTLYPTYDPTTDPTLYPTFDPTNDPTSDPT